jgi:hypothetical protein
MMMVQLPKSKNNTIRQNSSDGGAILPSEGGVGMCENCIHHDYCHHEKKEYCGNYQTREMLQNLKLMNQQRQAIERLNKKEG